MRNRQNRWIPCSLIMLAGLLSQGTAICDDNEGFTEPRYHIEVAAPETGIIQSLNVEEGRRVTAGQVLGVLDDDTLAASVAVAKKAKECQGAIRQAQAELALKQDRLKQFEQLRLRNHASAEELERAQMEQDVAEAQLLAAQEAQELKVLEHRRAEVQLARRRIVSPIDGVVIQVHKDKGEFVSPMDAVVFTVVQLDPLLATFSIPAPAAGKLSSGQKAQVAFFEGNRTALGTVVFISPVINPQSGTVKVKVEIPNPGGLYRSGERCRLLPGAAPKEITRTGRSVR